MEYQIIFTNNDDVIYICTCSDTIHVTFACMHSWLASWLKGQRNMKLLQRVTVPRLLPVVTTKEGLNIRSRVKRKPKKSLSKVIFSPPVCYVDESSLL